MKILTFGEIMLRLTPNLYERFTQANQMQATFGGGEANVAVSLAQFGLSTSFVSKLPNNDIAKFAVNTLRGFGVDTSKICYGGERLGIYFLEKGASQRPSKVIYDRKYSSISTAKSEDFDWDEIFTDVTWFHFTGITPALSPDLASICLEALMIAKSKNITVSCDINYRKKLWTKAEAKETMSKLMPYVDICIANEEDAGDVFDIHAQKSNINTGEISLDGYRYVAKTLMDTFKFKQVAITLRESINANDNMWSAILYDGEKLIHSKKYPIHIVDRVGGGDSFSAGLIYASMNNYSLEDAVNFAVAASCLKHTIEGDFNLVSLDEVINLMGGNTSGRVQR